MSTPNRIIPIAQAGQRVTPVRASSWGSLFDCAHKWEGEHLLGIRKAAGLRAQLGTAIHASTGAFDAGRLPGAEPVRVDDAAGLLVDALRRPEREVDMRSDELTVDEAERIGLQLHTMYCYDLSPRLNFLSVEQALDPMDIDCGGGEVIRLTGTMDRARVATTADGPVIPDVKTGTRVIAEGVAVIKGRSAQLGAYQLMYERSENTSTAGAQVLALSTSGKPKVAASPVFDAKRVMVGTDTQPGLIEFAADMFRSGLFPPNPQSVLCSPKYCARWSICNFHE